MKETKIRMMKMRTTMAMRTTMKMLCRNPSLTMVMREQTTTLLVETANQIQACLNQKEAVGVGSEICWRTSRRPQRM
jgi:P pilus assembly chaperone PapD